MKIKYEYEVGDYVTALENGWNDASNKLCKKIVGKGDTFKIKGFVEQNYNPKYKVAIGENGECVYIEQYNDKFRPATEPEIKDYSMVNPREWWVVVDCQDGLSGDGTRLDQEQAERIAECDNHHPSMDLKPYRAIKVREIIE